MLTALALVVALSAGLRVQSEPAPAPRLVVLIVVDQMIPEQLRRLEPQLQGGFRRFLDHGTVFWNATLDYAATETGPGHASVATGLYPAHHGIVGNLYYDREARRTVYCVGDPEARPVRGAGIAQDADSVSPARLLGPTLGELLRQARPGSKTVSLAGKDRSAVLMGGRGADAVLWWDTAGGGFMTSSAYGDALPEFAAIWNKAWLDRASGWSWECSLEGDLSALGTRPDDRPGEPGAGSTFPHLLPSDPATLPGALFGSPLVDFFTLELATLAIDANDLGRDDVVDFLAIGLSGCDAVGHTYGPYSVEVSDLLVRDDRELERFFGLLDGVVGEGRWLACLTSDHGVMELPEMLAAGGVGARRIGLPELTSIAGLASEALEIAYPEAGLSVSFVEGGFALNPEALAASGLDPAEVRALVAEAVETSPLVAEAYPLELLSAKAEEGWLQLYARNTFAGRGPDVALRLQPWLLINLPTGTSHGSPYPYDRRIPLAFVGPGVSAQQRYDAASNVDVVPTLLAELGLAVPAGLDGKDLKLP